VKKALIAIPVLLGIAGAAYFFVSQKPAGDPRPAVGAGGASNAASPESIFLRDAASGVNQIWRFVSAAAPEVVTVQGASPEWRALAFVTDGWNGDDLLLWQNGDSGALRLWRLGVDGKLAAFETVEYSGNEWRVVAVVDADGDRNADLVWSNQQGELAVWTLIDGKARDKASVGRMLAGAKLVQVGDFDGDGNAELFFRNEALGVNELLALQGTKPAVSRRIAGAGAEWTLVATGALDAMSGDDVLWRDTAGYLVGWSGADATKPIQVPRVATPAWDFSGLVDIDADGRAELFWRKVDGDQSGAWRLDAGKGIVDIKLPTLPRRWTSVPHGFVQP
jgi:hypothetical protein